MLWGIIGMFIMVAVYGIIGIITGTFAPDAFAEVADVVWRSLGKEQKKKKSLSILIDFLTMWCYFSICANFFKIVIISVPRALKRLCASTELLLKQKCGRTLCTPPQCFGGKGGGVQKCGTRAKFCEMLGCGGKVFRKIPLRVLPDFWRDFGGQH